MTASREVPEGSPSAAVMTVEELPQDALEHLFSAYDVEVHRVEPDQEIPGSHWGAPEAGIVGSGLYVRPDTPVHSALHEGCHLICAGPARRRTIETDAGGDELEESAVCYLQIVLADRLAGVGSDRLMADMDIWGYSFRLGTTRDWFEHDAQDAMEWLAERGLEKG